MKIILTTDSTVKKEHNIITFVTYSNKYYIVNEKLNSCLSKNIKYVNKLVDKCISSHRFIYKFVTTTAHRSITSNTHFFGIEQLFFLHQIMSNVGHSSQLTYIDKTAIKRVSDNHSVPNKNISFFREIYQKK